MAGAGYKLFNTGDVLTAAQVNTYLMEQTVMVFADAAARTTALSGVVSEGMISYLKDTNAVEVYNGSAWVASDDPNAIQNTIVDAKGDLIAASAADTPARLAVGNNGDTLLADSAASVGLRYQEPKAGNPVINSSFQVWQRGTSFTIGNGYTADRWYTYSAGAGRTASRQTTSDTTNLPNIQYAARIQRDSGNSATNEVQFYNVFETVNSIPFAGKTLTLSFYARRGANYAPSTANALEYEVNSGANTDANPISSGTWNNKFINGNATLTTTWQRFSFTGTMPATDTQLFIRFRPGGNAYTGTAGANDWFEVTGVQLEVGSVATPFKTQGVTLQGELAACQRYYWRSADGRAYSAYGGGYLDSTTEAVIWIKTPVTMRVRPSAIEYANLRIQSQAGSLGAPSAIAFSSTFSTPDFIVLSCTVTGGTATRPANLCNDNNTAGYFGLTAEL